MSTELIELRAYAEANGGITEVASTLGVTKGVFWAWLNRGQVPADQCPAVERATGVRRWALRPDDWFRIWPELMVEPGAPAVPATTPEPS
jgi:DNA-binding transcriptional regulator YdaS (Cro superfamily)